MASLYLAMWQPLSLSVSVCACVLYVVAEEPNQWLDKASHGDRLGHLRDGDMETIRSESLCSGGGLLTMAVVFSRCRLLTVKMAMAKASSDSFFAMVAEASRESFTAMASFLVVAASSSVSSCKGW